MKPNRKWSNKDRAQRAHTKHDTKEHRGSKQIFKVTRKNSKYCNIHEIGIMGNQNLN